MQKDFVDIPGKADKDGQDAGNGDYIIKRIG
jgi:hypothetical protein